MLKKINLIGALLLVLVIGITGCTSVPNEAVSLSNQLGESIVSMEKSHKALLRGFFDEKRKQIDVFIVQEYTPVFAENFFAQPDIANAWDIIVKENDKNERLTFLLKTGPQIQSYLAAKRLELIAPLDDLERKLENKINAEYEYAQLTNNSITALLSSAAKVTEKRQKYLSKAGIEQKNIDKVIHKTDDIIGDLLSKSEGAEDKIDAAKKYKEKLSELLGSI